MKLAPLSAEANATYHYFQQTFSMSILYNDDMKVVCFGAPALVAKFISTHLLKTNNIYYYNNTLSNNPIVYVMNGYYAGISPAELASEEAQQKQKGPRKSEVKPAYS